MTRMGGLAIGLAVAAVAVLMMSTGAASALGSSNPVVQPASIPSTSPTASPTLASPSSSPASAVAVAASERLSNALTAAHVPQSEQLLPSMDPGVTVQNGMLTPKYSTVVAPVGIADYGIQEVGGKNVASISYTRSVEGVLDLKQLNLLYLDSEGPDEFTAQENAVLTGVTVHGDPNLQFWTQNVIYYYQSSHTLHLASAIVNFSSSAFNFPASTIVAGNGFIDPGFGYFNPDGPAIVAAEPFTITFIENAAVVNNEPAVYFNYSVTSHGTTTAGSYDLVEFNASAPGGVPPTPAPLPGYQINGKALGGTGYIPNDVELILGGDGGGSTASVVSIDGTMQLSTEANGTNSYAPVPAAYDFGSETGETITGIAEWASGGSTPTVHMSSGPSIETPLWGVKGSPPFGHGTVTLHLAPSNAFVFVSPGTTFDANAASWAGPVPVDGTATYDLPAGSYAYSFLLSDHTPQTRTTSLASGSAVSLSVKLASNPALGVYTPLWAWSNSQLAAISAPGGAGTVSNPYVLDNRESGLLNPLFAAFNDYIFPVFSGVQLVDTTDYVSVADAPAFAIAYSLPWESYYLNTYLQVGLFSNNLGYGFYGVEHVSVVSAPLITGWFFYAVYGAANMIFWNSSDNLVAGNNFEVPSLGIYMFGGVHNTLWGNALSSLLPAAPYPGDILNYGNSLGLELWESHDLIYNNAFATAETAATPPYNPYDFSYIPEAWTDTWNVAKQPATDQRVVNGWILTGNILGLNYEGGNYWANYGTPSDPYGVLPYNNGGAILVGGDYVPLTTVVLYEVDISEVGLPTGTSWSVTINGYDQTTTGASMVFYEPAGTYAYVVGPVSGYVAHPAKGAVVISSHSVHVHLKFTK
ncbi:MAG: thermopsin family protease [Thermoplasmata archaeon]